MRMNEFKLEVFFEKHEFTAPYLLTQSDCESMTIEELLSYEEGSKELLFNQWLGYSEVPGKPELRKIISGLYKTTKPENIIVHSGAQEPIFNFMNIFLNRGDHVITQFPIYQSLFEVANSIGCDISMWSLEQDENGWKIDIEKLEKLITEKTKLIVINSPNNPTGYAFTEEELKRIIEIAKKHNIYIFCDEVYKGIELDGIKRPWMVDLYEKGISLGVMSKAYGLAGLRIGWLACKDEYLLEELVKMKHYTTICSSVPSEFLSLIALKHSDELLERNKKIIEENLSVAEDFFSKYKKIFKFNRPMAGPVAFLKILIDTPISEFCDDLIKEKGVLLLPANIFSWDKQYFRIGLGRKNFKEALEKFEEYLIEKNYI